MEILVKRKIVIKIKTENEFPPKMTANLKVHFFVVVMFVIFLGLNICCCSLRVIKIMRFSCENVIKKAWGNFTFQGCYF